MTGAVPSSVVRFITLGILVASTLPAQAQAQPAQPEGPRLALRAGSAMFLKSQSLAAQHLFKPSGSLRLYFPLDDALWLGAGLSGIATGNSDYQVAGAYGVVRYALVRGEVFEWGVDGGLGVGTNPPILYADLESEAPVVPFLSLSTDASWALGDRFRLGVSLGNEQLSVMHLGAFASYAF